jgi:soluble lytic murein transglycosylase-like protein
MSISDVQSRISTIESRIDQISQLVSPSNQNSHFPSALAAAQNPSAGDDADPSGLNDVGVKSAMSDSELDPIVSAAAQKYGVDPQLIKAVIQTESSGNPNAVSNAGAQGLMQLMPSNVTESGVTNPFDPAQNINAGVSQLSGYLKEYNGNIDQALAAYNAGPGAVKEYGGVPPYHETEEYIKKIHGLLDK